jgi:hypothetical protein
MTTRTLHISKRSYVKVRMGHKIVEIILRLPLAPVAKNALKAVYGKRARVTNGRGK